MVSSAGITAPHSFDDSSEGSASSASAWTPQRHAAQLLHELEAVSATGMQSSSLCQPYQAVMIMPTPRACAKHVQPAQICLACPEDVCGLHHRTQLLLCIWPAVGSINSLYWSFEPEACDVKDSRNAMQQSKDAYLTQPFLLCFTAVLSLLLSQHANRFRLHRLLLTAVTSVLLVHCLQLQDVYAGQLSDARRLISSPVARPFKRLAVSASPCASPMASLFCALPCQHADPTGPGFKPCSWV